MQREAKQRPRYYLCSGFEKPRELLHRARYITAIQKACRKTQTDHHDRNSREPPIKNTRTRKQIKPHTLAHTHTPTSTHTHTHTHSPTHPHTHTHTQNTHTHTHSWINTRECVHTADTNMHEQKAEPGRMMVVVGNPSAVIAASASPFVFMYKNQDDADAPAAVTCAK